MSVYNFFGRNQWCILGGYLPGQQYLLTSKKCIIRFSLRGQQFDKHNKIAFVGLESKVLFVDFFFFIQNFDVLLLNS